MTQASCLINTDLDTLALECKAISKKFEKQLLVLIEEYMRLVNENQPLAVILAKKREIEDVQSKINQCNTESTQLALKAISDAMIQTDVKNAKKTIGCSIAKLKIALDKLENARNTLIVAAKFLELVGIVIAATTAGGPGLPLAAIASVVMGIDGIVSTELSKTLSAAELEEIAADIAKNCVEN
jgi:hypothetical protein